MTSRAGAYARVTDALSLAALNDGDALSITRLQNMLDLTPSNLITHLREFEDAGYLTGEKTWDGAGSTTTGTLTTRGRAAPDAYTETLRNLLGGLAS
jgi:DNA-binding MarR family transcriptional regulator